MDIYERYVELRDKRGVKDAAVARDAKITKSTFTDWKNGRSKPGIDKLQKIADYFGVPLAYFTDPDDVKNFEHQERYYINAETAALAQKLLKDPNYRILFDAAEDSRPEDLQMVADLLRRFKEERR